MNEELKRSGYKYQFGYIKAYWLYKGIKLDGMTMSEHIQKKRIQRLSSRPQQ